MQLALYQPDIPQNTGSMMRLCACLGVPLHIIEPCGFAFDEKRMRRAALDYGEHATIHRHSSWPRFLDIRQVAAPPRVVLVYPRVATSYLDFTFRPGDILLLGQETCGVPEEVAAACDAAVAIPMKAGVRSLNVAQAACIVLAEALRQTGHFGKMTL
ncbi:MAG: tRNA (cytidine(34)-2'-O)-methyltransferase [Alphaproteobacteria bacterium]|nr:tRNA (cytidine(34)-2'-O)-methyltransferase [Alphaproteobacteria bacterium]